MAGYKVAGSHVFWNRVVDYIIQGWLWICRRKEVGYKMGHMFDGMEKFYKRWSGVDGTKGDRSQGENT